MKPPRRRAGAGPASAPGATADAPPSRLAALAQPALVAAATALAYAGSLSGPFLFDDLTNIVRNPAIQDLRHLWPPSGGRWLGNLTFALNHRLGGLAVGGYHLVNLAIHVANALAVLALVRLLLEAPRLRACEPGEPLRRLLPLAAALLFALHPLATQAVTYVVQRFTSLATLGYLLAAGCHLRGRLRLEAAGRLDARAAGWYAAAVASAAAAMLSKEISVTLPAVLLATELLLFGASRRALLLLPLAATALLVPWGLASGGRGLGDVLADAGRYAAETTTISRADYALTQARVVVRYLAMLVLPIGQNLDHDVAVSHALTDPWVLPSLLLLLAVLGLAAWLALRPARPGRAGTTLAGLGLLWFFATLVVESSFIPIRDVMFEHRTYLPGVGFALAAGAALLRLAARLPWPAAPAARAAAVLCAAALPLGAATVARNRTWRDGVALWSDAVEKSPRKARPRFNLGQVLAEAGRAPEAERAYREGLGLEPSAGGHVNLGNLLFKQGRLEAALAEHAEALRLEPGHARAHNGLGLDLAAAGRHEGAVRAYREALRLEPKLGEAWRNLGVSQEALGRAGEAVAAFREALRLDPRAPGVRAHLADALDASGRTSEAVVEYLAALADDPRDAAAANNLGAALLGLGRPAEAAEAFGRALAARPDRNVELALGTALEQAGRPAEAVAAYRRALGGPGPVDPARLAAARQGLARLGVPAP